MIREFCSADTITGQFLRYLVVGGLAFLVDYGTLLFLTDGLGFYYLLSATIAFCAGTVANYALAVTWVFPSRSLATKKLEFIIFAIIGVIGLGWTLLLMYVGTDILGCDYRISKLVVVAIVLCWNFGARKAILFTRPAT